MSTETEYRNLLATFSPRPIRSERDYRRSLAQLEKLITPRPGAARSLLIEVLSTLIERYESREHPTPYKSPAEALAHLLESRELKSAELAKRTDIPATTISNVLAGRRGISKANALRLAKFFHVSPVIFLAADDE